jgi:hypothetical protein
MISLEKSMLNDKGLDACSTKRCLYFIEIRITVVIELVIACIASSLKPRAGRLMLWSDISAVGAIAVTFAAIITAQDIAEWRVEG